MAVFKKITQLHLVPVADTREGMAMGWDRYFLL